MSRLLRLTGFGVTGARVDAALRAGPAAHVLAVLAADPERDPGALATPMPIFEQQDFLPPGSPQSAEYARDRVLDAQGRALASWWIRRMVAVHEPFGEKLTFLWHGHFATSSAKVNQGLWMAQQNARLRRLGRGDFRDLALAMLTDAAMLDWLDGNRSTKAAPNENLSREFMELFALGHGDGYSENDVREGARALTGWKVVQAGRTKLVARQHDNGIKTVLGRRGNLDQVGFCDAVLARPESARYVAQKWWSRLVSGTAPSEFELERLVTAYGEKRSLAGLLHACLTTVVPAGTLVQDPVNWLIGLVRTLRVPVTHDATAEHLLSVLTGLGQVPLRPPDVSGWPSGQAWLSTASADLRFRAASALARQGDLSVIAESPVSQRIEAVGHLLGIATWSSRSSAAMRPAVDHPPRLVAIAANTPEYLTV